MSFMETINNMNLSDKYKRNRSKIQPLVQVLKSSIEAMKPNMLMKATEFIMNKDTYELQFLHEPCDIRQKEVLVLSSSAGYAGVWNVDGVLVNYTLRPTMLVKNLQSKYRDLSVFWFMDSDNRDELDAFISANRFYTVVYAIECSKEWENEKEETSDFVKEKEVVKEVEKVVVSPLSYASVLKQTPPIPTYASVLRAEVVDALRTLDGDVGSKSTTTAGDSWSDSGSHGTLSSYETIPPSSYRGGNYNKTEFENVREYYQKWGRDRMFVMFGTRGENFSPRDKSSIRNLLNNVLRDSKYQELIRDNEYYYIKVVKNFHYDSSKLRQSYHFNIVFKNEVISSSVYHIYVDQDRTKVVRVSALFNDMIGV